MSLFAISWMSSLTSGWILAKLSSSSLAVGSSDAELFIPKVSVVAAGGALVAGAWVAALGWDVAGGWLAAGVAVVLLQPTRATVSTPSASFFLNMTFPLGEGRSSG